MPSERTNIPGGPEPEYDKVVSGYESFHHPEPFRADWGGELPELTLAYETWGELSAAGDNAVLLNAAKKELTVDLAGRAARYVHLLAASGDGDTPTQVIFKYDTGAEQRHAIVVEDWFDDFQPDQRGSGVTLPPAGVFMYTLIDKLDRATGPSSIENVNDPAVFEAVNDILVGVNDSKLLRWLVRRNQKKGIKKRYREERRAADAEASAP